MIDIYQGQIDKGLAAITTSLGKFVAKGRISEEDRGSTLARITTSLSLSSAALAQAVIEAIVEDAGAKKAVFTQLDEVTNPAAILASNTSSIPITELAGSTRRPDKVIGMHFMNPVPVMTLVEVIRGMSTSDETLDTVMELARKAGKTPVEVHDYPGFVSNRVLMPMINEAVYCLMEGVASAESIDTIMRLGMNHPMGPLALADLIGLDVCLSIMEVLHRGLGDDKYRPCPLLRKMVAAGRLGRKAGRGFFEYE
jgi:3-hydroxybutyryl-CoA dehydrogenase